MKCQGPGCRKQVASPRPQARYCSSGCRRNATLKRAHDRQRAEKAEARKTAAAKRREAKTSSKVEVEKAPAAPPAKATAPTDPPPVHALVVATRKELEDLDAVDTVNGQLAIVLAGKVAAAPSAPLVKDLRTLMAEIRGGKPAPAGAEDADPEPSPEPEPEDEVTKARKIRDAKIREAAS